jgi:hypothetical protein
MIQAIRVAIGSFIFLMTLVGACVAGEYQFSCKGQVIQEMPKPNGQPPSPIDLGVSFGSNRRMSLKIGDGKPLIANVTSNNKLQLKFKTSRFVGEYFHYSGDLFLIYNSGQLARLTCVRS